MHFKNRARGNRRGEGGIVIIFVVAMLGYIIYTIFLDGSAGLPDFSPQFSAQKTESSADIKLLREKKEIGACKKTTGLCYRVMADMIIANANKESVRVNKIYFDDGGYAAIIGGYMGSTGHDTQGGVWEFSY